MEFFRSLIEKLSTPVSKSVGVYISSDSQLEVVVFDKELNVVKNSGKAELKYDNVLRQVDLKELEATLYYFVNELDIPRNYPFYVSLPNILTSVKTLPADLEDIELDIALNSEAEKSYIFKKAEPKTSWILISSNEQTLTNTYIYSVIQREQIESIQQIFANNNLKLHAIDTSFACLIRGLSISGILSDNIQQNDKWAIVTISYNNYIIAKFDGGTLLNIIETPLALKSIEPDSLYPTISAAVSEKLGFDKLDNLYLVSQTSDFIAEKLTSHIKIICNVHTIDNNKFKGKPIFLSQSSTELEPTSPESIGAACWKNADIDLSFNFSDINTKNELQGFLGKIGIRKTLHLYLFIGLFAAVILIGLTKFTLTGINSYLKTQVQKQSSEIKNLKPPPKEFDIDNVIISTFTRNLDVLNSYDAIGASIPEKIWIESFFIDDDLTTIIKGNSYNIEDIKIYFENLKTLAKFKNLKIKSINVFNGEENPRSNNNTATYSRQRGMALPAPPWIQSEKRSVPKQKYYEFVFNDVKTNNKNDSIFEHVPESLKKIFGN